METPINEQFIRVKLGTAVDTVVKSHHPAPDQCMHPVRSASSLATEIPFGGQVAIVVP